MNITRATHPLKGEIKVPGDKSISHRSIMFGALSKGDTQVTNFLNADDCLSTISCFRQLGINIDANPDEIVIHGKGLYGLKPSKDMLYTGNSGTTTRLISGILAAQNFETSLTGDASIEKRPMKRIITPLSLMGSKIESIKGNDCAPLKITGQPLHGISYQSPIASAQVKSAILLAGLYADGETRVTEPALSRNHTELMLKGFGADIQNKGLTAIIKPAKELYACEIKVPSDISSAAYWIAAALLVPGSELLIKNVGINETRAGILRIVKEMGGYIEYINERKAGGEAVADLYVKHSSLHGTSIFGEIIPTLIDEIPILCVLAAYAEGQTVIRDAADLHNKECDRIEAMVTNLKTLGVDATALEDGMIINGNGQMNGGIVDSYMDHRIAMSFAIGALMCKDEITIKNPDCISISYPGFFDTLHQLMK